MNIVDSTTSVRVIQEGDAFLVQRFHPRTEWFTATTFANERDARAAFGSLAELVGEVGEVSPETLRLR